MSNIDQRRWLWQVLCLLLGFVLLFGSIYLYYAYKIRQLEQRLELLRPTELWLAGEAGISPIRDDNLIQLKVQQHQLVRAQPAPYPYDYELKSLLLIPFNT